MKKRVVIVLLTGLVIASLAGCGAKADATDQSPESSVVGSEADDSATNESIDTREAGGAESASNDIGAEDENIVLYAEIAEYGPYGGLNDFTYT